MALLTIANLEHNHGARRILDGVTFSIEAGERVGLVGRNGTGKTTLLNIIAGRLTADAGQVQLSKGATAGYLQQDPVFDRESTLFDSAKSAFADVHRTQQRLEEVSEQMSSAEGEALDRLMRQYDRLMHELEHAGGFAIEHRVEETLHGLGFVDSQFTLPVRALSGGQRSRLALACLLLEDPDLLLLDEPTNHLDIEGRIWLENFLTQEFPGSVLVVSHDRYLLDNVVDRILEVEPTGRIASYPGNYAKYRQLRYERRLMEQRVFEKQMDHVRSEKKFIDRYKAGQRAKQAAGRQSRLERFKKEMQERPVELQTMKLNLPKAPPSGDVAISCEGLSKRYGDRTLFTDFTASIKRGTRIGIIGPNGTGKSTLIRCLLGEIEPDAGEVTLGARISVGYFSQIHEHIDLDYTIWQYLQSVILSLDGSAKASEQQARDLAGAFLFSGDDQEKQLRLLSGGERSRVVLAGVISGGHNLLVLDEPTNHFDIPSSERLEEVLNTEGGYEGTLLLVTHDRALLDACVDELFILQRNGVIQHFYGNYAEWQEQQARKAKEAQDLAQAQARQREQQELQQQQQQQAKMRSNGAARSAGLSPTASAAPGAAPEFSAAAEKRAKKRGYTLGALSKLRMQMLESEIEKIEKRLREIDDLLMTPDTHRDGRRVQALSTERAELQEDLIPLEFEWSRRADEEA